ncbi:MAG TPA: sugar ABC transporter ATP-binding protein [Actinophytocola sp.]|jgi:rhamnose transport system ATP-binding protein|uniref:sugar ABC transporter ATP-binding protein n=1 Tax=Actinophytocola sp. TaxID=1872138 RepID=UPI002DFFA04A|nr:sugar ABC transporter ATP-binding protein [Actinophytocola sp.]
MLTVHEARKHFGGVAALDGAQLTLRTGEIHGLVGENGAGKSTLLKTLAGVHRLDSGEITFDEAPFDASSPRRAREAGVAVIYQEPSLFPDLSLAENVFVGRQPRRRGRVDWAGMRRRAEALFAELGVYLDPERRAAGLSIADQQLVEIAKALSLDAKVIVMDEPTAALSASEAERLLEVARRLRDRGAAVVFVSHRLEEVFALCDRVTVMRDGRTVAEAAIAGTTPAEVVRWMVGRELTDLFPKVPSEAGEVLLEVRGMRRAGVFEDISFTVARGEIVALAGLVGSGRSEVVRAVFGIDRYESGTVLIGGSPLPQGDPRAALARGVALVPEDRRQQGLFMVASVARNSAVVVLDRLRRFGLVSGRAERGMARDWADRLRLRYSGLEAPVERLSGGNQQKVVLAKWLATEPELLVVDEPTRGIDVATKAEVHRLLSERAARGLAVLMISSELPEVLGMADRVLVMREGRLVAELTRAEATQERIMLAATGQAVPT